MFPDKEELILRGYELCLIFHSDVSEENIDSLINTLSESIIKHKGTVLKAEKWGKKNFKFLIKKQSKGFYCFLYFEGNNEILRDIERIVKYKEIILRYNTIRLEKTINLDESKEASETVAETSADESAAEKAPSEAGQEAPADESAPAAETAE